MLRTRLLAIACLCALAAPPLIAQRLGPTFPLPDSLSRAFEPSLILRNSNDGLLYVFPDGAYTPAEKAGIAIVDPRAGRVVANIPFIDIATGVCYDPVHDRMFAGMEDSPGLFVIDCARRAAAAPLVFEDCAYAPVYYAPADRVYFADDDNEVLVGMDCATGAEVLRTPAGYGPFATAICAGTNTLFCVATEAITVVDCLTNTVVAQLGDATSCFCTSLYVDETRRRVYIPFSNDYAGLLVLDAATGGVLDSVIYSTDTPVAICYNSAADKIYVAGMDCGPAVIDASTNRFLGSIQAGGVGGDLWPTFCCSPASNRLCYVDYDGLLSTVDCSTDCVLSERYLDEFVSSACWDPGADRVFFAGTGYNVLHVVDCATDSLLSPILTSFTASSVVIAPQTGRMYVSSADSWFALVIDPATGRLLDTIAIGDVHAEAVGTLRVDSARSRAYVQAGSNRIAVLDLAGDSVVAAIDLPRHDIECFCLAPDRDRIYLRVRNDTVLAIDTRSLQVAGSVPIGRSTSDGPMDYDPGTGRLFCPTQDGDVTVIDASADTIVGRVPIADLRGLAVDTPHARVLILHLGYHVDSLTLLDATTLAVVRQLSFIYPGNGIAEICSDPVSGRFYCMDVRHDRVFSLDAMTGTITDSSEVLPRYTEGLYVNHAQNQVWCWNSIDETATALDAQTLQVECVIPFPGWGFADACAMPDGSIIYVPVRCGGIATIVNHAPVEAAGIMLPPTHTSASLVTQSNRQCLLIDACGRVVRTLAPRIANVADVPSGVYFIVDPVTGASRRTTIVH
jgi:DNA-binding beta-propeller fold protein YncE